MMSLRRAVPLSAAVGRACSATARARASLVLARGLASSSGSSAAAEVKPSYSERMAKTGRPVSPHVTVYRFPIVSISSITNRVTGVLLSVGVTGIGALTLAGVDAPALMHTIGATPFAPILKFGVAFPLVYHYLGGVRHIMWDKAPDSLTNDDVSKSSYLLFGSSGLLSVVLAFVRF